MNVQNFRHIQYKAILIQSEKDITLFLKKYITNVLHFNPYLKMNFK